MLPNMQILTHRIDFGISYMNNETPSSPYVSLFIISLGNIGNYKVADMAIQLGKFDNDIFLSANHTHKKKV